MEIMTKALRGLLNRAKFAVEQKRITITVDAATIASIVRELLEFREVFAEGKPAIERAHEYVHKYSVDFNLDTNDVIDTVLDDAERLRAVIEQQATEIAGWKQHAQDVGKELREQDHAAFEYRRTIAGLREALDGIYDRAELGWDDLQGMRLAVLARAHAALNAQPDAVPAQDAIKVGDKVMIANGLHKGVVGIVQEIHRNTGIVERYNSGRILHIPLEQLERI